MKKRILSLFVVCLLMISLIPIPGYAQTNPAADKITTLPVFNSRDVGDNLYEEYEPNDAMDIADLIEYDDTYYGTLFDDDMDVYVFYLEEKSLVYAILVETSSSAMFGIYDSNGDILFESEDLGYQGDGFYGDAFAYEMEAGTYYIGVWDDYYASAEYLLYFFLEAVPPHVHAWGESEVSVYPTCLEPGESYYVCTDCGEFAFDIIPAWGHTYGADGFCSSCGIEKPPFEDVAHGVYYYDAVKWAVEKGITTGTSETTFSPDMACSRGQVVTFLWRAAGSPAPSTGTTAFTDVVEGAYYYDAVLWAVEQGITNGVSETEFAPNMDCSRGQIVTFLHRAMGKPESNSNSSFIDLVEGAYYYDAVLWAVEKGVTQGTGDGKFSPDDVCTRSQIVTFLYRAMA